MSNVVPFRPRPRVVHPTIDVQPSTQADGRIFYDVELVENMDGPVVLASFDNLPAAEAYAEAWMDHHSDRGGAA